MCKREHLAFDLSLKALRHSFAVTKEGLRKASLSLKRGGLNNFLGPLWFHSSFEWRIRMIKVLEWP